MVLTNDRNLARIKQSLNEYPLVYSIREANGFGFREVSLVDFFSDMSESLQKLWRDLLVGRDTAEVSQRQEVEGQLKTLYTAIIRCIQRLRCRNYAVICRARLCSVVTDNVK